MYISRIAVFCGSVTGNRDEYKTETIRLAKLIAKEKIELVYGGGNRGLMGLLARTIYENDGTITGVLPEKMNIKSVTDNASHTRLIITKDMHERKRTMYNLSDAFVALPGGIGTIEELAEIYTWRQLGLHNKNIALFNISGYWDYFIKQLEFSRDEGFIKDEVVSSLIVESDPEKLLQRLKTEERTLPSKL